MNTSSSPASVERTRVCPEFILEVRSRSDRRSKVEEKIGLWMENGAELAQLIDPIDGLVTIHAAGKPPRVLVRPELVAGEKDLWRRLRSALQGYGRVRNSRLVD